MANTIQLNHSTAIMSAMKKILIVDDEEDICYFLSRNLSRRGFLTSTSHTLREAEQQMDKNQPDILLLDNHLPDGRGLDFVVKINYKYPRVKVIMITAHRRENWGEGIQNICIALNKIVEQNSDVELVYLVHLNPVVKDVVFERLGGKERIHLLPPLDTKETHKISSNC